MAASHPLRRNSHNATSPDAWPTKSDPPEEALKVMALTASDSLRGSPSLLTEARATLGNGRRC